MSVDASKAPLAPARRRRSPDVAAATVPKRDRDERGSAEPLEQSGAPELCRADTERDEQHRATTQTTGPATRKRAPAEPIRVAREDRREHHFRHRLRGTDEPDVDAARPAVSEVAEPELDGDPDSHRPDSKQTTGNEQRSNRSRGRVAQLVVAGCLEHAGNLLVRSRVLRVAPAT